MWNQFQSKHVTILLALAMVPPTIYLFRLIRQSAMTYFKVGWGGSLVYMKSSSYFALAIYTALVLLAAVVHRYLHSGSPSTVTLGIAVLLLLSVMAMMATGAIGFS